ncbi:hypothetical protein IPZ61_15720 [Streptomyces sioyaensis]|uniref:hypothetical protein n=1 Tax=Streptomyces sioyaensis TaxID=67364 RepID=UPI001F2F3588|nr:hypothetical protein [Streptomyces sioyaensis]MCF3174766.1 hypothetical protein [Streptomyces sioyaensis]
MNERRTATNYFQQASYARPLFLASLAAMSVLGLTGCDAGPECLHYTTQVVPHTTFVNGKVVTGTSIMTVCTEYAKETRNG